MKRLLAHVLVALIVIAALAGTLGYRKAYGTWWGAPERIDYCGRTYLHGYTGLNRATIEQRFAGASFPGDAPYPLVTVGKVPPVVGRPLLAAVVPEATRHRLGVPCTMGVYLQTGADEYTAYGLLGGP